MNHTKLLSGMLLMGMLVPLGAQAQSAAPVLNQKLADEFASFTLSAPTSMAYGIPGKMNVFQLAAGRYDCDNDLSGDPAVGIQKACYSTVTTQSSLGAKISDESGGFTLTARTRVAYGITGQMRVLELDAGRYTCGNGLAGDPAVGILKACYAPTTLPVTSGTANALPVLGNKLADENGRFTISAPMRIAFGVPGKMHVLDFPAGTHNCERRNGIDPAYGILKACYGPTTLPLSTAAVPVVTVATAPLGTPAPTTPVVTTPTPTPTPTNPSTGTDSGTPTSTAPIADPTTYRATAATFGTDAGITYRYGSPSTKSISTTYSGPRPSKSMNMISIQNPNGLGNRGCGWTSFCGTYQIGNLEYYWGDYSSNIMNISYIPDATPGSNWPQPKYFGVASIQQMNVGHSTISITPEPSWTRYNGPGDDGGANDSNHVDYSNGNNTWGKITLNSKPIATTRGYGRGGWTNNSLTVWSDGLITSSGSNTSHNYVAIKLPTTDKVPTAIAISNSGEFAFVTVWDTANVKGQVGVVALSDGCQGCYQQNENQWFENWGNGRQAYPGFPGLGNYNGGKFIGWVDLPKDMVAPTEVAVTTGKNNYDYQRIQSFWNDNLLSENSRRRQYSGDLASTFPRTGMLTVVSKSEKKAAFIDLRPLFSYYREKYLNQSQSDWSAMIANRGNGASQWPYTFDNVASQKPVVIKTMTLDDEPTAVRMTTHAPHRALVGTKGGTLRVMDLGNNYLDQNAALTGTPSDIVPMFSVQAGANVTSIGHQKEKGRNGPGGVSALYGNASDNDFMWTLSRADKKAVLWQFNAARTSMTEFRTLQDSHMVDPIALEDGDNHGTESYILSLLDYSGKAVHNYTYGPIRTWTDGDYPCPQANSCLPANGAQFEYFGKYPLPGKPFQMGLANIN